jgi:exonuclease SbcD
MRILHTADWHVGRTIRGRARTGEHEAVLAEIVAIAERERADLVIVAGDQFDTAAPSPEAERIVYGTLMDLAETGAAVVVLAGNHDHPGRLAAVEPLLSSAGVEVAPRLARPDGGGQRRLEVAGEGVCLAILPFVSQRGIVKADHLMDLDADEHQGRYVGRLRQVIAALCDGFGDDTVNLVAGHMMVHGAATGGSERAAHTVFEYAVPAGAFPADAHYVALGHLHRVQRIDAGAPVWYSGSPLQLDFGETGQDKAVMLVDTAPGVPARVESRALTSGRRLSTLTGAPGELESFVGTTGDDHLRVVVRGQATAGLADQIRDWFPDVVDIKVEPLEDRGRRRGVQRRLARSPRDLFVDYLRDRDAMDDRVTQLFDELMDEVHATDTA